MAKTLAKLFIILTLVFEGLTIFTGSQFYSFYVVGSAVVILTAIVYHLIMKIMNKKMSKNQKRTYNMASLI